jgi:LPS O-antigen subunit length determinant protein (WzzB/FepE family)
MNTQTIPGTDFPLTVYERKGPPPLLNAAQKKQRRGLLAKIHIAKAQMGLNGGEYEMILRSFKVETAADMTIVQLENMVKLLKHYGWKEIYLRKHDINPEQLIALRQRCIDLAREIPNGEKRLAGLASKICGTSQLIWCHDIKKIERLLAVLRKVVDDEEKKVTTGK